MKFQLGIFTEREDGSRVAWEPRFADKLIERGLGRIDEVVDVDEAAQLETAGGEADREEEVPIRIAHIGVGGWERCRLLCESEIGGEPFGHVSVH